MKKVKALLIVVFCLIRIHFSYSQIAELSTLMAGPYYANGDGAYSVNPFSISYNTYHWQVGSTMIVEVFQDSYTPAYAKYMINLGYGFGANYGNKQLLLIEQSGDKKFSLEFGPDYSLSTQTSGYDNNGVPIILYMKPYLTCRLRITHSRGVVNQLQSVNEIQLHENAILSPIADFNNSKANDVNLRTSKNLQVEGDGNHYIKEGNVGIGTTAPRERLSVNGKIRAHEIKVETANWPDYVFQPDYELKPLSEVATFIKENGHLPEVPKAAVVEEDGVSLGEMNRILLKKVEELTLHLIEKEEKLIKQEKRIADLELNMESVLKRVRIKADSSIKN